jgi:hypothetical protein
MAQTGLDASRASGYERIGDKVSLETHIHEVTGIPFEALRGPSLDNFSTSERMAWAARRETTEEEDGWRILSFRDFCHFPAGDLRRRKRECV